MEDSGVPRLALVIGSQCEALPQLSFLPQLAIELYEALIDPKLGACTAALPDLDGGGLLIDPTRQQVVDALRSAFDRANNSRATLIIAMLGHGIATVGDFYYLTIDSPGTGDIDRDVDLSHRLKRLLADNGDLSGLIMWLDTCHSGVAAQQASQWNEVGLKSTLRRFEILSATGDDPAYNGDFSRALLNTLQHGVPGAGETLDANDLRPHLSEGAQAQRPQRITIDGGGWERRHNEGLWLAYNVAAMRESHYQVQGRTDFLLRAADASHARCCQRRRSAGLSENQIKRSLRISPFVDSELLSMPRGSIKMLTGPLGSGKSDIADAWFRSSIERAQTHESHPVPVWLPASVLTADIESRVIEMIGKDELNNVGVDLVIDGVDERADLETEIFIQVEEFVAQWPHSRILVTTRSATGVDSDRKFPVKQLSPTAAIDLIERVADIENSRVRIVEGWPSTLVEAVQRPLFALLAARHIDSITGTTGAAELIDLVVADVVRQPELQADVYRKLAVELTRAGRPVDPRDFLDPGAISQLHASPLLTQDRQRVAFSLATFEQWFAAQALIGGEVHIDEVISDMAAFNRWKYVLAIVLATGPESRVDKIMTAVARWNPGAGAWVVDEALNGRLQRNCAAIDPGDWRPAAERVRMAASAWLSGFEQTAKAMPLINATWDGIGEPTLNGITIGLTLDHGRLSISWMQSSPTDPNKPRLPDVTNTPTKSWTSYARTMFSDSIPTATNWVWARTRNDLAKMFDRRMLTAILTSLPVDGLARKELESAFRQKLTSPAENQGENGVWPGPDLDPTLKEPRGSYSEVRAFERACAVLRGALDIYLEIADSAFPRFSNTLGHRALMPVVFEGNMHYKASKKSEFEWSNDPGFYYWFRPAGRDSHEYPLRENSVQLTLNGEVDFDLDAADDIFAHLDNFGEQNPEVRPFLQFAIYSGRLAIFEPLAATQIAMEWIWNDLKNLGWVTTNCPKIP